MWLEKMDFGINGGGDIVLALMIDRERGRQAKRKTEADGAPETPFPRGSQHDRVCHSAWARTRGMGAAMRAAGCGRHSRSKFGQREAGQGGTG